MQLSRLPVFSLAVFAAFAFGLSAPSLAEPADGEIPIEQQRAALNREQADFARRQIEENAANQRAYEDQVKAREIEIASQQDETARQQREHEAAMQRWRDDVAACQAGDKRRCAGK